MPHHKTLLLAAICAVLPKLALADSIEPVIAAFKKLQGAHFRTEITMTDDKSKVVKGVNEYESMERIHMNMDGREMIMLPGDTWMHAGDKWTKSPIDMSAMVKRFQPLGEEMLHSSKNVRDEGATTFNGQSVHAYSFDTDTTVMGIRSTGHDKVYIDRVGQVIGMEHDGEAMGRKSHTVQTVTYDNSIRVTAPN